ncbi:hypothetical protein [Pseudomonas sp. KNUC1026]|uniref:hypothetical protein n=1 Tax=Pseudomonas sp. KNUC1026 TaxID=2893890 RepID=UPI001F4842DB|nr:hypothetical protein [Pseudomonas sp. KNUC1026]UFH48064.1 hypothetical protein LN139_12590 [Pseudomonas sp. KNUC1026]
MKKYAWLMCVALAACKPSVDTSTTDAWVGRWVGPEGLALEITRPDGAQPGHYRLSMQYTLDDRGTFDGVARAGGIGFSRPDGEQVLRATDGDGTGMKWLAGKHDRLVVKPGEEGYCRG